MWTQFFLENTHFAINVFAALVFFAVFWLYFDAWIEHRTKREVPKLIGFILLSISFLLHSVTVESSVIDVSFASADLQIILQMVTRILGYAFVVWGLLNEPLQKRPTVKGVANKNWKKSGAIFPAYLGALQNYILLYPVLAIVITLLYLRRATIGLESHIKRVALAFGVISVSEVFSTAVLLRATDNIDLYRLVEPFGVIWILEHIALLAGVILLGYWVWQYLLERLQTQLFMIFTVTSLAIFLVTTISFTALLLKNMQDEALGRLKTDVRVLNFAINTQEDQILTDSQAFAKSVQVADVYRSGDFGSVGGVAQDYLLNKKLSTLIMVNEQGQVKVRAEDLDRVGDSLSGNLLVRSALLGEDVSSVSVVDGVTAPQVYVLSAVAVKIDGEVRGAVLAGSVLDNVFVDRVKSATGLEVAIYGENVLSATTLVSTDGKSRWVGVKEENPEILETVLRDGNEYVGSSELFNVPYYVVYSAMEDLDEVPIGMLFVGQPQHEILQAASRSIETTFLVAALLIVFMVWPSYKISRYISYQLQ